MSPSDSLSDVLKLAKDDPHMPWLALLSLFDQAEEQGQQDDFGYLVLRRLLSCLDNLEEYFSLFLQSYLQHRSSIVRNNLAPLSFRWSLCIKNLRDLHLGVRLNYRNQLLHTSNYKLVRTLLQTFPDTMVALLRWLRASEFERIDRWDLLRPIWVIKSTASETATLSGAIQELKRPI